MINYCMTKIRLHQFLSKTGEFSSKKEILNAVKNSEIIVDNKVITNQHHQLSKGKNVYYRNKLLKINEKIYLILNKPEGYLSSRLTNNDLRLNKKSLFSLIKLNNKLEKSLSTIGRLDESSSGLIILTNDGDLIHQIAHPKFEISKTYFVELENELFKDDKLNIEKGIIIDLEENWIINKYKTKPSKMECINKNQLYITISEGKKREIRRIFESIGNKVLKLKRIKIGNLNLEELNINEGKFKIVDKKFLLEKIKLL